MRDPPFELLTLLRARLEKAAAAQFRAIHVKREKAGVLPSATVIQLCSYSPMKDTLMIKSNLTSAGILVLLLIGLIGCATYEKCGIEGCADDRKITANVRAAFDEHPQLGPPNSINVETLNGVVYLTGHVSAGEM